MLLRLPSTRSASWQHLPVCKPRSVQQTITSFLSSLIIFPLYSYSFIYLLPCIHVPYIINRIYHKIRILRISKQVEKHYPALSILLICKEILKIKMSFLYVEIAYFEYNSMSYLGNVYNYVGNRV